MTEKEEKEKQEKEKEEEKKVLTSEDFYLNVSGFFYHKVNPDKTLTPRLKNKYKNVREEIRKYLGSDLASIVSSFSEYKFAFEKILNEAISSNILYTFWEYKGGERLSPFGSKIKLPVIEQDGYEFRYTYTKEDKLKLIDMQSYRYGIALYCGDTNPRNILYTVDVNEIKHKIENDIYRSLFLYG